MADKVKPLKIESSATGGTEDNPYPTETDPAEDYLSCKGISFTGSDNYLMGEDSSKIKTTVGGTDIMWWASTGVSFGQSDVSVVLDSASYNVFVTVDMSSDLVGFMNHMHNGTAAIGPNVVLARSRGSHGSPTIVSTGDALGYLAGWGYTGNSGVGYQKAAQIKFEACTLGTPSTTSMPGAISFLVSPDSSVTPAEAVKIYCDKSVDFSGTIMGGSATSDGITIRANTATLTDTNTGRITIGDPVSFNTNWTTTGSGGLVSFTYISVTGVVTTAVAVTLAKGFYFAPEIEYSTGQVLSSNSAFHARPFFRPTSSLSDTASQQWGFNSQPTMNPTSASNASTIASLGGYHAMPRIIRGASATSATVTQLYGFVTYESEFLQNDLTNATVTTLVHFKTGNPVTSGSNTVTNHYGARIINTTLGTNIYGVAIETTSGSAKWGLYHSGTAQSVLGGKTSFGKTTAPAVDVDINGAVAYGKSTVSLTADNQTVTTTNISYISLSSNDATATNRTFILGQSTVAGHQLTIEWTGTNAGELIDDSAQGTGGNHRLSANWTPTQYDTIHFISNGTDWIEVGRSAN